MMNLETIQAVAKELGGTARIVFPDAPAADRFYITLADHVELFLRCGGYGNEGRIDVSGSFPSYIDVQGAKQRVTPSDVLSYDERGGRNSFSPSITVSDKKTPERIADDIRRRLLPELIPIWHRCDESALARTMDAIDRRNLVESLAELTGGRVTDDRCRVYFTQGLIEHLNIATGDGRPAHFRLMLTGISVAQFERIFALIKENDA